MVPCAHISKFINGTRSEYINGILLSRLIYLWLIRGQWEESFDYVGLPISILVSYNVKLQCVYIIRIEIELLTNNKTRYHKTISISNTFTILYSTTSLQYICLTPLGRHLGETFHWRSSAYAIENDSTSIINSVPLFNYDFVFNNSLILANILCPIINCLASSKLR